MMNTEKKIDSGVKVEDPSLLALMHRERAGVSIHRYGQTTNLKDLGDAIDSGLLSVASTPDSHPELPGRQEMVGVFYGIRYRRTGHIKDLEASVQHGRLAVAATPTGHPDLPRRCQILTISCTDRYMRTGNMEGLEDALQYGLLAVAETPVGHSDTAIRHQSLARSYRKKYQTTGKLEELEAAIKHNIYAITSTPENHPGLAGRHQSLALSYTDRYRGTSDINDLEASLKHNLLAVALTPEGHVDLADRYGGLAVSYIDRYERIGDAQDLDRALKHILLAVALTPENHPGLAERHEILAVSYRARYNSNGDLEDLEAALKYHLSAVALTPKNHSDLASRYQNLAMSYRQRYGRTDDLEDLEAALEYFQLAVTITPEGHPALASRYQTLAVSYSQRYARTQDLGSLEASLKYNSLALSTTPKGHTELASRHSSLAVSYGDQYIRTGKLEDLEAGLIHNLSAVALTPEGHLNLPGYHQNLAVSFSKKFKSVGDMQNLAAAMKHEQLAIDLTPDGDHHLIHRHANLAESYLSKYTQTRDKEDLHRANKQYKYALQSSFALPQDIFNVSKAYIKNAVILSTQDILIAYTAAFNTLPSLLWLGSSLENRHEKLIRLEISTFISKAVSFSLQVSLISLAVEYFEQGLSTTFKQKLQLEHDYGHLRDHFPMLSQKFHQISIQLHRSSQTSNPAVNYHALADERMKLLTQIRQCSGFENFLLPPQYSYLCSAAVHGPVIMLNFSSNQANAIIILSPSALPVHLSLANVSENSMIECTRKLKDSLSHFFTHSREIRHGRPHQFHKISSNESLLYVTSWLWETIVEPIFCVLKNNGIHDGRLWWCPSGPFTYLPLHAAAPIECSFIQSYTPTLESLIQANSKVVSSDNILTAVGISEIPNQGYWTQLPSVEKELDSVTLLFGKQAQQLKNSQATTKNVMEKIQTSSWLHLACHGQQDLEEPLKSSLILYDGKLKLESILDIHLANAKFVYLSACETAMGDSKLMNEAMHLAGGFLAAGFQGGIGTLWSMPDAYGPIIAEVVYRKIIGDDNIPNVRRAAEGLHLALQMLRKEGASLHQWMPFVHFGI